MAAGRPDELRFYLLHDVLPAAHCKLACLLLILLGGGSGETADQPCLDVGCHGLNCIPLLWSEYLRPSETHLLKLNPNVMILEGGAFGKGSGHEGEAHMNWIRALIKEVRESSLTPAAR